MELVEMVSIMFLVNNQKKLSFKEGDPYEVSFFWNIDTRNVRDSVAFMEEKMRIHSSIMKNFTVTNITIDNSNSHE